MKKWLTSFLTILTLCSSILYSQNQEITPLALGNEYGLIIDDLGKLYYIKREKGAFLIPVGLEDKFIKVYITHNFALALSERGKLFESELTLKKDESSFEMPILKENEFFKERIKDICATAHFALILTENGEAYFKGFLDFYYTKESKARYYKKTTLDKSEKWELLKGKWGKIASIFAGPENIFLIDTKSKLFSCGHNEFRTQKWHFGEFPSPKQMFTFRPITLEPKEKIVQIADLGKFILLVTENGKIYGRGTFAIDKGKLNYQRHKKFIALFDNYRTKKIIKSDNQLFLLKSCGKKHVKIFQFDNFEYIMSSCYLEKKIPFELSIKNNTFCANNAYLTNEKGELILLKDDNVENVLQGLKARMQIIWSCENHWLFPTEFKDKIYNYLLIEYGTRKTHKRMRMPKVLLFMIFSFLSAINS